MASLDDTNSSLLPTRDSVDVSFNIKIALTSIHPQIYRYGTCHYLKVSCRVCQLDTILLYNCSYPLCMLEQCKILNPSDPSLTCQSGQVIQIPIQISRWILGHFHKFIVILVISFYYVCMIYPSYHLVTPLYHLILLLYYSNT